MRPGRKSGRDGTMLGLVLLAAAAFPSPALAQPQAPAADDVAAKDQAPAAPAPAGDAAGAGPASSMQTAAAPGLQAPQPPPTELAPGADAPLAGPPLPALVPDSHDGKTYDIPVPSTGGPPRPLTLEEAFVLGSRHPSLKAARENIELADLGDNRVLTFWQPQVNATGTYTRYDSEIVFGMPDFTRLQPNPEGPLPFTVPVRNVAIQQANSFAGVISAQIPLFVGPLLPQLASAKDMQQIARMQYSYQERSFLLTPVAMTYYGAVAAGEAVEVARRTVEVNRHHYQATSRMFEVGQATRLAVLQAEIAVVQAEQNLRRAETGWMAALRNLEILLNVQGPLQLQHPVLPPLPLASETELLARALEQRTDYQAAQMLITVAERGRATADWGWAPTLSANGLYRISNSENFAGDKDTWQLGLALNLPLWDGGTRIVARQEANVKIRQAFEQRDAVKSAIASEINAQLKAVQEAEADLVTMRHTVALAREGVAAAQASYEVGMATNLEVLDANQKMFEAEIGLIQTQIKLDLARLQLANTIGTFRPLSTVAENGPKAPAEG